MSENLRVVTLESLHTALHEPQAAEQFSELLRLRKSGYGPDYPPNVLPYDAIDYVATHHLFLVEKNGKSEVIGGFRQTLLSVCDYYRLTLPILQLARDAGEAGKKHEQAIETMILAHRLDNKELLYSSRFTIHKNWRTNKEVTSAIKELVCALTYADLIKYDVKTTIGGSALRFKTEPLFRSWGYLPLQYNSADLPPLAKASAAGELVLIMSFDSMSPYAIALGQKHRLILESRVLISNQSTHEQKEAA